MLLEVAFLLMMSFSGLDLPSNSPQVPVARPFGGLGPRWDFGWKAVANGFSMAINDGIYGD